MWVLGLFLSCGPSGPPVRPLVENDHDRLIALMGGIDAHLLEIQRGAADPLELDYVKKHLAGMRQKLEGAAALPEPKDTFRARAAGALETVRELEGLPWTPETREDHYRTLRGLCAGCHRALAPPLELPIQKPSSWDSCGRCHEQVYKDWEGTLHARAWLDPVYRMSAGDPPKLECRGCHSMEPILAREISTDVSYRPVYRPYNHAEGVNCLSCHGLSDGSVAAARDVPGAPCRPRRDARLRTPVFCGACHNPSHGAYDEWKASGLAKTCTDCHATKDGKFTHRMRGVEDTEFVKAAVGWSCEVKGDELRIALTNRSGHKLPAEVPSRTLRVHITLDAREEELFFCRPNKGIVGRKDNRLLPGETRVISRPLGGARRAQVRILYQQSPFMLPDGWILIADWEKALDR